jgi:hypothetical protein
VGENGDRHCHRLRRSAKIAWIEINGSANGVNTIPARGPIESEEYIGGAKTI